MVSYEQIKQWSKEHKTHGIYSLCFVIVFFLGFGTGRVESSIGAKSAVSAKKEQVDYTIKSEDKPTQSLPPPVAAKVNPPSSGAQDPADCVVKGNISGKNKIYHIKGGAFYNRVKPELCFPDSQAAEAAGFVKSQR